MAKNATSNAFIASKKRREELANLGLSKSSLETRSDNNFEEQHHHLLACLEHATVNFFFSSLFSLFRLCIKINTQKDREFIEIDSNMALLNSQLLQLKIQNANRFNSAKLVNDLFNCLCCTKKIEEKNSTANESNENTNVAKPVEKKMVNYFG